ncbi:MAG: HD domain-containing phosphohydrolase [Rhodothermales bacterium]
MNKILFVDDEPAILRSYQRYVGLDYDVDTALGGEKGLEMLEESGPYGVVVSDMRMPGMNGAEFLSVVRQNFPDSVRMLLTGQADMEDTIDAVNNGRIYRFLTKPCPPETLGQALDEGLELYRLRSAEKDLLEQTLKGTIKLLGDILSIVSPELFSRSSRVRDLSSKIAEHLGLQNIWKVEVAAMLANIGCITIPKEVLAKKHAGKLLNDTDAFTYFKHLKAGKELLGNIPRLEEIAEAVAYQEKHYNGGGHPNDEIEGDNIPIIARILKVANDYDLGKSLDKSHTAALGQLLVTSDHYDPSVIEALKSIFSGAEEEYIIKEIRARTVVKGMILAEGVRTKSDLLLVAEKQEISDAMMMCIHNFAENRNIIEPIRILVKRRD